MYIVKYVFLVLKIWFLDLPPPVVVPTFRNPHPQLTYHRWEHCTGPQEPRRPCIGRAPGGHGRRSSTGSGGRFAEFRPQSEERRYRLAQD